jgi:hypothetical protein
MTILVQLILRPKNINIKENTQSTDIPTIGYHRKIWVLAKKGSATEKRQKLR